MKKKLLWLVPPLLAVAFFLLFVDGAAPRHIFLITLDTTRADALDYSQSGRGRTPNLAALAAAGTRFANAYSVIPITFPSHAAMFYSMPPHVLKVYNNGQERAIPYPSLAEIMKKNGYATGAVVSLAVLNREFGLAGGFDHYLENFRPGLWYRTAAEVNRDAFSLIDRLGAGKSFIWIHYSDPHEPYFAPNAGGRFTVSLGETLLYSGPSSEQPVLRLELSLQPGENVVRLKTEIPAAIRDRRDFTGVSFADLHVTALDGQAGIAMSLSADLERRSERYGLVAASTSASESSLTLTNGLATPCRAELRFKYLLKTSAAAKRAGYGDEVRYMDAQIGLLLEHIKKAGLYEDSAFLLMGDHGEGLGEYAGHFGHIHYLNKVYSHVPFIVSGKDVRRAGARSDLVSNFSVAPTLLALIGAKKPDTMIGSDALAAGAGQGGRIFLETYSPEAYFDAFSVIHFPWQVIFYPGRPQRSLEFFDLGRDRLGTLDLHSAPDSSGRRAEMTNSVLKISRIITANKRRQGALNQKTMDKLKSLGYL